MHLADNIAAWLRRQLPLTAARGFVVGLSGGVDSAVVVRLCQLAVPGNTLAVILPCHSDPQDERDAQLVARHFGLAAITIDLGSPFDALAGKLAGAARSLEALTAAPEDRTPRLALANVKARLRMVSLYYVANRLDYLVVGTANRCERTIGYFTKHGDGAADLQPLGNLLKKEVYDLARELSVPAGIIRKPPSAGLWLGQTDEEEMGFTYAELEQYLEQGPRGVDPATALKIERLTRATDHKRRLPPMFAEGRGPAHAAGD